MAELHEHEKVREEQTDHEAETDQAVEETQKHDSDALLESEKPDHHNAVVVERAWHKKLWAKIVTNKKVSIPVIVVVVLAIVALVPFSRYEVLGLFLKDNYTLAVWDSQTNQPVSSAMVSLAGALATTDNNGVAHLKVKVGHHTLAITKKYYNTLTSSILVPIHSHAGNTPFVLTANGRLVSVSVVNKISGKPVGNATVKGADSETQTDNSGKAIIVLPPDKSTVSATITASGYNDTSATIQVTNQSVNANDFQITPAGKVYFLSNLSGTIDVVKTNLDGTDRQTVLQGTGNEDPNNTVMLASTDWKYLALLAVRKAGANPELDLIDATNGDQISNIDEGNAEFTLTGWDGDSLIYEVRRSGLQNWQSNQASIKSFNAVTKKLTTLDSTTASGTNYYDYIGEYFANVYIFNDSEVVYAKNWQGGSYAYNQLGTYSATLNSVQPDGSGKKVIKSFGVVDNTPEYNVYISLQNYEPGGVYILAPDSSNPDQVYKYEDGKVTTTNDVNSSTLYTKTYNYYLVSPSATKAFWSEPRDGKNVLFVGDQNGNNGKQIASLSDYDVYGWFTDDYLLVFKNSSELYIMPVAGGNPIKITDYYKPVQRFDAYGGR